MNLEDHFAGDGIGHAEITAKVLQHLAAAIERRDHSRPRRDDGLLDVLNGQIPYE